MTSSFPRLLAAWLGVRVANRKKVRCQSLATHESGGLSPFRGHSSALNACGYIISICHQINPPYLAISLQFRVPGPLEGPEVDLTPFVDLVEDRPQAAAQGSERILDLGWHLGINLAMDDPIPLQRPEVRSKHLLSHVSHQPPQLAGPLGARKKMEQDIRLPLARQ